MMQKKQSKIMKLKTKARESFGEEGGKIIHGCLTRSN
jgi:hypothetical protein